MGAEQSSPKNPAVPPSPSPPPRAREEPAFERILKFGARLFSSAEEEETSSMAIEHLPARNHERIANELKSIQAKDFDCTQFGLVEATPKRLAEVWEDYAQLIPMGDEYTKFVATTESISKGIQMMQVQDSQGNEFMSDFEKFDTLTTKGKTYHLIFVLKPAAGGTVNAAFRFIEAAEGTSPEQLVAYLVTIGAIAANEHEKTLKYFFEGFTEESNASEQDAGLIDTPAAGSASDETPRSTGTSVAAPDEQPGPAPRNGTDQPNASQDEQPRPPPESAGSHHPGNDAWCAKWSGRADVVGSNDAMTMPIQQLPFRNEEKVFKELVCIEASQFDCSQFVLVGATCQRLAQTWQEYSKTLPSGDEYRKFQVVSSAVSKGIQSLIDSRHNGLMEKYDTLAVKGKTYHMIIAMKPTDGNTVTAAFRFIEAPGDTSPEKLVAYLMTIGAIAADKKKKSLVYFFDCKAEDSKRKRAGRRREGADEVPEVNPDESASNVDSNSPAPIDEAQGSVTEGLTIVHSGQHPEVTHAAPPMRAQAGIGQLSCNSAASFVSGLSSDTPHCFVPRTSFKIPDRLGGGRITAAELRTDGGDVVLGPGGREVTTLRSIRRAPCACKIVHLQTEGQSYPFQVTLDHRIIAESADDELETMTLQEWRDRDPHPRIYDGVAFQYVTAFRVVETVTEIVEVTFVVDEPVLAWVLPKRASSARPPLRDAAAVACHGARLQAGDFRLGDFGLGTARSFLDFPGNLTSQGLRRSSSADARMVCIGSTQA